MKIGSVHFLLGLGLLAAACGDAADEDAGTVTQWLGDSPHFALHGTFEGKPMNIRVEGDAAKGMRCSRFYNPLPNAQAKPDGTYDPKDLYLITKEIGVVVEIDGKPTEVSVGYWRHDPAAGATLEVIPRVRGTAIPEGKTWVDVQYSEPGSTVPAFEKTAEGGTLSMKLNSGTPEPNGVFVEPGRTGEFISIDFGPQESLTFSATADCKTEAPIVWGSRVLLPQ